MRDDVTDPLWWDVGFLAIGAALIVGGLMLLRHEERTARKRVGPALAAV